MDKTFSFSKHQTHNLVYCLSLTTNKFPLLDMPKKTKLRIAKYSLKIMFLIKNLGALKSNSEVKTSTSENTESVEQHVPSRVVFIIPTSSEQT